MPLQGSYKRSNGSERGIPRLHNISNDQIQNDIQLKLRHLKSMRTLGYSYLAPLGVGKTMEMIDEEIEMKRQMEEQFESQQPATVENLMGEVNDLGEPQVQAQTEATPQTQDQTHSHTHSHSHMADQDGEGHGQAAEGVDLDDDIPEAEENSYSLAYDDDDLEPVHDVNQFETQYDRGFMVEEQYESQDVDELSQRQPRNQEQQHTQFATPTRVDQANTSQQQIGRFVQNRIRNARGPTAFVDSPLAIANASIYEPYLVMSIDE